MKKTNTISSGNSASTSHLIALSVAGIVSLAMFSSALTASAALTRQLEVGMRGSDVSELQTFLATDPSVYPQGLVTGYFGPLTRAAVMNFQAKNGISSVGRVGPITLAAISSKMGSGGTTGADVSAPSITALSVTASSSSAIFNLSTSENATSRIHYSTAPLSLTEANAISDVSIGGTNAVVSSDLRQNHSVTITGLSPNTTYYYSVYARDSAGNVNMTWPTTFNTANQ